MSNGRLAGAVYKRHMMHATMFADRTCSWAAELLLARLPRAQLGHRAHGRFLRRRFSARGSTFYPNFAGAESSSSRDQFPSAGLPRSWLKMPERTRIERTRKYHPSSDPSHRRKIHWMVSFPSCVKWKSPNAFSPLPRTPDLPWPLTSRPDRLGFREKGCNAMSFAPGEYWLAKNWRNFSITLVAGSARGVGNFT
jgi:hypothetical protein